MRKVTLLFVMLALFAMSIVPAFAQDDTMAEPTQTIAEIVITSTTSDTPEFTTLLTALQAADPAILEALSGEGQFTVFAPTDAAFATLFEGLSEEVVARALANTEGLTEVLSFHIHDGSAIAAQQIAEVFNVLGLDSILPLNTMNGQSIDLTYDSTQGVTVNGAFLVMTDIMATNGIIHVIDTVILPETRDIVSVLSLLGETEIPEFDIFRFSVQDTELRDNLSDPEAVYTVFAPINTAFEELFADTYGMALLSEDLAGVLSYHVVEGLVNTAALNDIYFNLGSEGYEPPAWFVSLEDTTMEILTLNGETLTITSISIINGTVNDANILRLDVDASNGVIYFIDAVLIPPTGE